MHLTTNISIKCKLFNKFYKNWIGVSREFAANLVDDYTITQKIDELEQLARLHCNRVALNKGMIVFDDVFVQLTEPEGFDPMTSDIEGIFIYKYKPTLYINAHLSVHIDRVSKLVQIDSLLEIKEKQDAEWHTIEDNYWQDTLTFQQVKEMIHGCLL